MRVRKWKSSIGTCSFLMPSSWSSFLCAALLTPSMHSARLEPVSPGIIRGWEQHVLVHMSGKVIFSEARCCRRSSFLSLKRKTEKAR